MNRDEFEQGVLASQQTKNFSAFAESDPIQTAGLSSGMSREVMKLVNRSSAKLVANKPVKPKEPDVVLDELHAAVDSIAAKQEPDIEVTTDSIAKGINSAQNEDDIRRLVETAATFESQNTPRTFKDVQGNITSVEDAVAELEPVFKGKNVGLLTDRQLYGLRSLMVTASDQAAMFAQRIANGDHTPELLLQYQNSLASYNVLSKYAKGQSREIARALNSQKMVGQALSVRNVHELEATIEQMTDGQGHVALIRSAKRYNKQVEKRGNLGAASDAVKWHWIDDTTRMAVEFWKNNILSGWGTHAVNLSSVGLTNIWENVFIRPIAATSGAVRQMASGKKKGFDRVYYGEQNAAVVGSIVGMRGAFNIAAKTLLTGESAFGAGKAEYGGALHKFARDMNLGKFGEVAADASSLSFRLLRAEDDVVRGLAFAQQLYAIAYRDGMREGLDGEALAKHMNKILDNPSEELYNEAIDYATKTTFTNTDHAGVIGVMAQGARTMTGNVPALQFVIPFVNTPANLLQYAVETSPAAVVSTKLWKEWAEGGAKRDVANAKIITGISFGLMLWQLYEEGHVTGVGHPTNFQAREMLEREGVPPVSIKYGDNVYGMEKMDPFSISLAAIVGSLERAKYAPTQEEAEKHMVNAFLAAAEPAFDSMWMGAASDLVQAFDSPVRLENWMANMAGGMVPYSGTLKSIKTMQDPTKPAAAKDKFVSEGFILKKVKGNLPILSQNIRIKRYWDGTPIMPEKGGFAYATSPVKVGNAAKGDHVNRELFNNGIFPKEPSSVFKLGTEEFSLLELDPTEELYGVYIRSVGEARREILEEIVKDSNYKEAEGGPNSIRWRLLSTGLSVAKFRGLEIFEEKIQGMLPHRKKWQTAVVSKFAMDMEGFITQLRDQAEMDRKKTMVRTKSKLIPERQEYEIPIMKTD